MVNVTHDNESNPAKDSHTNNKWSVVEDKLLISGWLTISKDVTMDSDQKLESLWRRIGKYYNENSEDSQKRAWKHLKARWYRLLPAVNKFSGCYKRCIDRRQNGSSESDILESAHLMYLNENGKKFNWEHAWRYLKDEPKWIAETECAASTSKRTKVSDVESHKSLSRPDTTPSRGVDANSVTLVEPIDQDNTKKKGKRKKYSSCVIEGQIANVGEKINQKVTANVGEKMDRKVIALERLATAKEQAVQVKKEAVRAQEVANQQRQLQIEYEIIMKDKSHMTEEQLTDHNIFCDFIRSKYKK